MSGFSSSSVLLGSLLTAVSGFRNGERLEQGLFLMRRRCFAFMVPSYGLFAKCFVDLLADHPVVGFLLGVDDGRRRRRR